MSAVPACLTLRDFEAEAARRFTPGAQAFFDGGAADELTLTANQADWAALRLLPRVLRPLAGCSTTTHWGARALAHPIGLAPVACQRLAHPDGEWATALAAAAQGAPMILSCQTSVPLAQVAKAFGGEPAAGPLWFQLYLQRDEALTDHLVQLAEDAGCEALVLTVDAPLQGVRDRERRAGFQLPEGIRTVHLPPGHGAGDLAELLERAPTWDAVARLRARTRLPIWLKGVLHPEDARLACAAGVAGLIVSNHGGRTLDTAVSSAWALPGVVAAVEGQLPVLVDGGIRRGTDVLKALALGACGVLVGRPQVHALAAEGALGVARMIRLLRDELTAAMALCGCRTVAELGPALLLPPR